MKLTDIINQLYEHGLNESNYSRPFGNYSGEFDQNWTQNNRIYPVRGSEGETVNLPVFETSEDFLYKDNTKIDRLEQLAFYVSYHFSRNSWGIFILHSGIYRLGSVFRECGYENQNAFELAAKFLIRHELAHFQTDFALTCVELLNNKSIYSQTLKKQELDQPPWNLDEEGLCNRIALSSLGKVDVNFKNFLKQSPQGYRDFENHKIKDELKCWKTIIDDFSGIMGTLDHSILATVPNKSANIFFKQVPIWYVNDTSQQKFNVGYLGAINQINEEIRFLEDLQKLSGKNRGKYEKLWIKAKTKLANGNIVGVHLHRIKENIHTLNLDSESRAAIRIVDNWSAVGADHHESIYRRINRSEFI